VGLRKIALEVAAVLCLTTVISLIIGRGTASNQMIADIIVKFASQWGIYGCEAVGDFFVEVVLGVSILISIFMIWLIDRWLTYHRGISSNVN